MKLSITAFFAFSVASTSALGPMRASSNLMKASRRLEQNNNNNNNNGQNEEEFSFLADYKLKMVTCNSEEVYKNPESGAYEYGSVVFRLCPAEAECSDESTTGCDSGYGDYVVGINSFVEQYLEAKRDEMQNNNNNNNNNNFNIEEYGECREYQPDQDAEDGDEDGNGQQYQYQYYVGPACSEDGTDIRLEMFTDQGCQTVSEEVTFEDISNGMTLPYSDGGLVSNYCESCYAYDNDNGGYALSEMCTRLYEFSGKCESNMETFSYYGMQEGSCELIAQLTPKSSSGAGKTVGWVFFALVLVGAAAAGFAFMKKKQADDKQAALITP